jgi:hypothetical protein
VVSVYPAVERAKTAVGHWPVAALDVVADVVDRLKSILEDVARIKISAIASCDESSRKQPSASLKFRSRDWAGAGFLRGIDISLPSGF